MIFGWGFLYQKFGIFLNTPNEINIYHRLCKGALHTPLMM